MEYTDELAEAVAAKNPIDPKTLRVWKTRGKIPDKYFDETGAIIKIDMETISDAEAYHLRQLFETDHLNIVELKSITSQQRIDWMRGQGRFYKSWYIALKREIADLHNKFRKETAVATVEGKQRGLKKFFAEPRIKPYTFTETKEQQYAVEYLLKGGNMDALIVEQLIINIGLFFQSVNL